MSNSTKNFIKFDWLIVGVPSGTPATTRVIGAENCTKTNKNNQSKNKWEGKDKEEKAH